MNLVLNFDLLEVQIIENINMGHIFWNVYDIAFIFDPCGKTLLIVLRFEFDRGQSRVLTTTISS